MKINLSHTLLVLRDDDVIQMDCDNHYYTLSDLKEINEALTTLAGGKRKLLLVIANEFSDIDKDSREYMATDESTQHSIAEAYVIKSLSQKIIANFYLRINKPKVPTMIFTNLSSAEKWLKSFL